ncbi:hypothetical protein MTR_2g090775 [Medicago truncatula]|uniref:Uncharacterized protein n=1 Tax=Medicago truncatula TaxID=3880 RepID=A0A072VCL4_MEDTR|nr:hypothetical protein MTR_2g090775 [Medicago truncatula]
MSVQNSYLYISFVPLELTSIFTRWHLKSLKMKHDLKTDSQHLTLRFVTKFVMIRKMIWFLFTTDDNSVESTHFLVVAHAWLLSFPINGFTYSPK